jgi:hypothetical protein
MGTNTARMGELVFEVGDPPLEMHQSLEHAAILGGELCHRVVKSLKRERLGGLKRKGGNERTWGMVPLSMVILPPSM